MFVLDPSFLLNHKKLLSWLSLVFSQLVNHFEPVIEAVEMVLGSACSCLCIKHMANSFIPLVQASDELNIPSSNVSKT